MADDVAWIFPGQGSQEPGMGKDLYESLPIARELFDRADAILGRPSRASASKAPPRS